VKHDFVGCYGVWEQPFPMERSRETGAIN
jgi:hypothetical protein